jgi:hypothetical protein
MLYSIQGTGIASDIFSSIIQNAKRGIGVLLSLILAPLINFVLAHPAFKARILGVLFRYPVLKDRLYRFAVARGLVTGGMTVQIYSPSKLTPSGLIIYGKLKTAIERHNKGD